MKSNSDVTRKITMRRAGCALSIAALVASGYVGLDGINSSHLEQDARDVVAVDGCDTDWVCGSNHNEILMVV
ncbi:hypothetical protein [Streptomyces bobili]|uniref:hypothetical protein n=1 Tax=Streptomyces bobili TaxID=67280 RepID=UPI00380E2F35